MYLRIADSRQSLFEGLVSWLKSTMDPSGKVIITGYRGLFLGSYLAIPFNYLVTALTAS